MYLYKGNVFVSNVSYASFSNVTITSNGYIEIPDNTSFSVSTSNAAFLEEKNSFISLNDAMWSWWTKPIVLRHVSNTNNVINNRTYMGFTQSNGAVGVAICDNLTGNTQQYTLTLANNFGPDDHNAGSICAGNNKVALFIQGRNVANANVLNPKNMFYVQWNEGETPPTGNLLNITFSTANTATASFYPNVFNANGKFILLGRQQSENTSNQWLAVTADWPLSNIAAPKGFFRSNFSWPYLAFRRDTLVPNKINFALGWHPTDSDSNRNIYYGNIIARTDTTTPWDVYANSVVIANITTGNNLPINENMLELVYSNPGGALGNNRVRLFDVHDGAVAFGTWNKNLNLIEYKVAYRYGRSDYWPVYTICSGGLPFHGVGVRDYFGGMAFNEYNRFRIAVMVNTGNGWELREYSIPFTTITAPDGSFFPVPTDATQWTLNSVVKIPQGQTGGRPMEENLSEDSMLNLFYPQINPQANLTLMYWRGFYDGSNFSSFSTTTESSRYRNPGPGINSTLIDTGGRANVSYVNIGPGSYVEVTSPTSNSGYTMGGFVTAPFGNNFQDRIDRFPFAVDVNSTNIGGLSQQRRGLSGQTSYINGYATGGFFQSTPTSGGVTLETFRIDKFPFVNNIPATNIGSLSQARGFGGGVSSSTFGYHIGGLTFQTPPNNTNRIIDKFPFGADSFVATFVGQLDIARQGGSSQQSSTNGYYCGGGIVPPPAFTSTAFMEKFLFAADSNANIFAYLPGIKRSVTGLSSSTNGYSVGGRLDADTTISQIDKFPFAVDVGATYVSDLSLASRFMIGQSSTTNGYASGGTNPNISPTTFYTRINKFPFATDVNATYVADLSIAMADGAGTQS